MFTPVFEFPLELKPDTLDKLSDGIPSNFIISRNVDGKPLSYFKDDSWNLKPYGARNNLNFNSWHKNTDDELSKQITIEIKTISWFLLFTPSINKAAVKPNTFRAYINVLYCLAKIGYRLGVTLEFAHTSTKFQVAFKSSLVNSFEGISFPKNHIGNMLSKFHFLVNHHDTNKVFKWKIVPEEELEYISGLARKHIRKAAKNAKQTPLIPSRILSNFLINTETRIKKVESMLNEIEIFFQEIYSKPFLFCDSHDQYKSNVKRIQRTDRAIYENWSIDKNHSLSREDTIIKFGMQKFLDEFNIGLKITYFKGFLSSIQSLCALIVLAYSGMRLSELEVIPFDCYEEIEIKGFGKISCIYSHTRKMVKSNYSKKLIWASSHQAKNAIFIAQRIAKIFWLTSMPSPFPEKNNHVPLWLSANFGSLNNQHLYEYQTSKIADFRRIKHEGKDGENFNKLEGLTIESSDINELVVFDAFRNWDEEERFSIGKEWPFASHQFRRSIAVYASRSGMVSLPSLGTQFKHLSQNMTALYAENSSFAQAFVYENGIIPDTHRVVTDFQYAAEFTKAVNFHEQVINAEFMLTGGRGTSIEISKNKNKLPRIMSSPAETAKAIHEGRMAYTETVVGGCMRKEVCASYGIDEIVPCIFNCADSVIGGDGGKKLLKYISGLELGLDEMDPETMIYKETENEILRIKNKLSEEGLKYE